MGKRVDALKADMSSKLQEAERLDAVEESLPAGTIAPRWILACNLYGACASLWYGDDLRNREPAPSWGDVIALVRALPPVAMVMVRAGGLSLMPASYVDALPESKKERWELESPISPVILRVEQTHGYPARMFLEWHAQTPAGLVGVCVALGHPRGPVQYHVEQLDPKSRHNWSYARPKVTLHPDMHAIHDADGDSIAQVESPIVWASGSPQSPSPVTIYFCDLGADLDPAAVGLAIVKRMAEMQ